MASASQIHFLETTAACTYRLAQFANREHNFLVHASLVVENWVSSR